MEIHNKSFYHIQTGGEHISHVGDILDIGSTMNRFLAFYQTFDLNQASQQDAYRELRNYFREQTFEDVRSNFFPTLPSRHFCLWVIPDKDSLQDRLKFWIPQVVGNIKGTFRILHLSCTGEVHYANPDYLDAVHCNSIQNAQRSAFHYWKGDNVSKDTPEIEALFIGKALVTEVIDPFNPKSP